MSDTSLYDTVLDALQRGAADDAVQAGHAAVAAHPDDARAHRLLAAALRMSGDNPAALASLDRAIALAPDEAALHLERGQLLVGIRQLDEAQVALAESIGLDPNQFPAYIAQAQMALGRNDLDEAERVMKLAARVAPEHPQVEAIQGMVALFRGETTDALSILSEAAARYPDDIQLLYALGFAHLSQGHLAFAEQTWRNVAERMPPEQQTGMRALLAQLSLSQGRPADALQDLAPLLAATPVAPAALRLAGEATMATGQTEAALPYLRDALAGHPGNRRTLLVTLEAWQKLGATQDARDTLDRLLQTAPEVDDLWRARLALEATGSQPARDIVERWVQARPRHLPALEAAMAAQEHLGDRDAIEAMAQQIVAVAPNHINARLRLIEGLAGRDPDAALTQLQQMAAQADSAPAREAVRYPLALALDRAGDADAALAAWLAPPAAATTAAPATTPGEATPGQWPGLADVLQSDDSTSAALAAWRKPQAEMPRTFAPPPPCPPRSDWPELAAPPESAAAIGLLWGAPGSVVEDVVVAAMAMRLPILSDRFSPEPPADELQRADTAARLANGTLEPKAAVDSFRNALGSRQIHGPGFIDWLPWWDNQLLLALRPHLPEALLLIALRDPRDMLLDWLAFGTPTLLEASSPEAAADWLAEVLEQVATLHEQDLFPHHLLRLDDVLDQPQALADLINQTLQTRLPPPPRAALGPQRFVAGRWRHYASVLAQPFARLQPIAQRLGYAAE